MVAVKITSIRLVAHLADEAKKVLGVKSRTEAVNVAARDCCPEALQGLDEEERGEALVRRAR
jgi:hypothetical protein